MFLLEVLIALTIGAIVAFALLQMLSESMRAMSMSGNEAYANEILNELSEHTRVYGYQRLVNYIGDHTLMVNKTTEGAVGPDLNKRPLLLDLVGKQWESKTYSSAFSGTVTYTVANGAPLPTGSNTLLVTITVTWPDSYSFNTRQIARSLPVIEL